MSGIIAQNTLDSSGLVKAPAGGGAWNFIAKQTASADATIDFTSGIDSTYREYIFTFKNIHPSADSAEFGFQADTGTNTNYNQTITSSWFDAAHRQDDVVSGITYQTSHALAQSTSTQHLVFNMDNGNVCVSFNEFYLIPSNAGNSTAKFM